MMEQKALTIMQTRAEQDISYYQDKIQTLNAVNEVCTNPEIKAANNKAIIYAMKCIQRIRLAQILELKHQALMEIVQSN